MASIWAAMTSEKFKEVDDSSFLAEGYYEGVCFFFGVFSNFVTDLAALRVGLAFILGG